MRGRKIFSHHVHIDLFTRLLLYALICGNCEIAKNSHCYIVVFISHNTVIKRAFAAWALAAHESQNAAVAPSEQTGIYLMEKDVAFKRVQWLLNSFSTVHAILPLSLLVRTVHGTPCYCLILSQ